MLWRNVERRIEAIAQLLKQAEKSGISNTEKSSYLRSAITILATVVEGLVYELTRRRTSPSHKVGEKTDHIAKQHIKHTTLGTTNGLCICEKVTSDINIDDDGVTFAALNNYLKNHAVISKVEFSQLNWVRKERNKLHLQGLRTPDTGYTRAKINRLGLCIDLLLSKM